MGIAETDASPSRENYLPSLARAGHKRVNKMEALHMNNEIIIDADLIPKERIESMARAVLKAVKKAFEDPEVMKDYERWLAERSKNARRKDDDT